MKISRFGGLPQLAIWSLPLLAVLAVYLSAIWTGLSLWLDPLTIGDLLTLKQAALDELAVAVLPPVLTALVFYGIAGLANILIKGSGKMVKRIRWLMQIPHKLITGAFRYLIFPLLLWVPIIVYVNTIDRFFVEKLGKL